MNSLTYLTLIITYRCPAKCAHCCIGAGDREDKEWMEPEDAEQYISEVTRNNNITWMTLIGGEALLDLERTVEIGKMALAHGIPSVQIDTNAAWCVDEQTTEHVFRTVYDAGLNIGNVSFDAFHQRYVPRERVLRFLQTAQKLGIPLETGCSTLQSRDADNVYDTETRELREWVEGKGFGTNTNPVVFHGRAANLAAEHTGPRYMPTDRCEGVYFFATEDFRKPGGVQIDVHGWVMLEHGICIGNAKRQPLGQILSKYDADAHPIIGVLRNEGPIGLTRIPEADGFQPREDGYVDKCHLCQEIRTYLRPYFPDILCPDSYYPAISCETIC